MFTGQAAVFSNREDWTFTPYSIEDDSTGELVDLTSASIIVEISDQNGCQLITGSIDDGKILLVASDTFQIKIPRSSVTNLCAGTYGIGVNVTNAGETISLIVGTISVLNGRVPI
jgi:hypothetical protein